jgi:outer membrane protein TolC
MKMRLRGVIVSCILLGLGRIPADLLAQERLSLPDAIARTAAEHPSLRAMAESERIAAQEEAQARAGWLPRLDYAESWQRSNQPVFVFGSLLAQSRFAAENFALDALNHPDAVTNVRGALVARQSLFDRGLTARVRSSELARELAALDASAARRDLTLATTRAYGAVLVAVATRRAAETAQRAADEDRRRAAERRDAGLATDADVLAFDVHAASMNATAIRAAGEEQVARATLNELIGAELDAVYVLDEIPPSAAERQSTESLEQEALAKRDQARRVTLGERLASAEHDTAVAAFLPSVAFQGGWEFDGPNWSNRQTWWMAGVELRWNVFNGLADRARLRAADSARRRAAAERERVENAIRLDVRAAAARLDAALARERAGRAAVEQAREAERIIRDRYEQGMSQLGEVLRASNAVLEAELQRVNASVDVFVSEAGLEWAVGR